MTNTFRRHLLASTLLAGALLSCTAAAAQTTADTPPPGVQSQNSAPPTTESGSEIVVTGSLIKDPNLVSSAPVSVIGGQEIQLRQSNTAEEILRDLPGAVPAIGSAVNNGNGGSSFVDLRGLGSNRNVVLLDGNRVVPSSTVGRTDLNNIPLALIERTESLTGGAATTYGADAVSGVVNFITRKNFTGVELNAGYRLTGDGDGAYYRSDLTIGADFDEGRGNAVVSIGYQHSDPVYQGDRSYSVRNIDSFSGGASGSGTTVPARLSLTGTGTVQIDPTSGSLVPTYQLFNFNPYNIYQTPFQRYNMYGAAHYDVADSVELYTRGVFSKNTVRTIIAPSGIFGSSLTIPYSNPYLPTAARTQFCGANGLTAAQCAAAAIATSPTDPNYRTFTTTVSRRTPDVGPRVSDFVTQFFDYRAGAKIDITSSINLDVSGGYGESENRQTLQNYVLTSRSRDAVLATNTTTCLSGNAGCVPLNIFGDTGTITPAMANYLTASSTILNKASLAQARALVTGNFGYTLPWAASPVSFAVGSEYRKYHAVQTSDLLAQTAGELGGSGGAAPNINGGYEVAEGYGELVAPLVADRPFIRTLQLEGGVRYSHYRIDTAGNPSFNTTTYKGGGRYTPVQGIELRGNYQRAVRAPTINELFTPLSTGLTSVANDPCAQRDTKGVQLPGRTTPAPGSNLYNICIAQGANATNIATIQQPTSQQGNITSGGNLALKPETADSYTLGVVLQPRDLVPGLTVTVDYYHIKIRHAITTPTTSDILTACFGSNSLTPPANAGSAACTTIRRNPTTGGLDGDPATTGGLFGQLSNAGTLETDGIDVGANYRRNLGFAKLNLSFQGNWTDHARFKATSLSVNRDCVGYYSVNCGGAGGPTPSDIGSLQPRFSWNQRTTLTIGPADFSLLWRHISSMQQEPLDVASGNGAFVGSSSGLNGRQVNFRKIPAFNYLDLALRASAGEHLDLTFTVTNLLGKAPPIVGTGVGTTSFNSGNTYPSTYDALGRVFSVGATVKF